MTEELDPDVVYEKFWKELIEDTEGNLDMPMLKRELCGYFFLLNQSHYVYRMVTGGSVNTPAVPASEVLESFENYVQTLLELARTEDRDKIKQLSEEVTLLLDQKFLQD